MTSILEQAASVGSQYLSLPKYEGLKKPRELPNPLFVSQNLQHIGEIKLKRWLLKLLQPKRGCLMTSIESWMQLITLSTTILDGLENSWRNWNWKWIMLLSRGSKNIQRRRRHEKLCWYLVRDEQRRCWDFFPNKYSFTSILAKTSKMSS